MLVQWKPVPGVCYTFREDLINICRILLGIRNIALCFQSLSTFLCVNFNNYAIQALFQTSMIISSHNYRCLKQWLYSEVYHVPDRLSVQRWVWTGIRNSLIVREWPHPQARKKARRSGAATGIWPPHSAWTAAGWSCVLAYRGFLSQEVED